MDFNKYFFINIVHIYLINKFIKLNLGKIIYQVINNYLKI